jgi:subtilisin family serine protease
VSHELIQNGLPLLGLRNVSAEAYQSTSRSGRSPVPPRDRQQHASVLAQRVAAVEQQLAAARGQALPHASGILVTAVGPGLEDGSVNRQLRDRKSGTDVVTIREGRAVVHAQSNLAALSAKIQAYASQDTSRGKPRFQDLVARLNTIEPATIEDLSLGEIEQSIADDDRIWVEIWMPGGPGVSDDQREATDEAVAELASLGRAGAPIVPVYRGPERDVHLVSATGAILKNLPVLLPSAVEVHRAPMVRPIVLAETADEAGRHARVDPPAPTAAAVAVHDTGITGDHPYLQPIVLGASSVVPGAPSPADMSGGHGTQMAGVAAYSRLAEGLITGDLAADAWLVSVRLLEPDLVMEAGNTAPGGGLENPEAQGLTVLTLESNWRGRGTLLRPTWATSPAAAAASNALARIANAHPTLRPATWRGLLAHTAAWPQVARQQITPVRKLLPRRSGPWAATRTGQSWFTKAP